MQAFFKQLPVKASNYAQNLNSYIPKNRDINELLDVGQTYTVSKIPDPNSVYRGISKDHDINFLNAVYINEKGVIGCMVLLNNGSITNLRSFEVPGSMKITGVTFLQVGDDLNVMYQVEIPDASYTTPEGNHLRTFAYQYCGEPAAGNWYYMLAQNGSLYLSDGKQYCGELQNFIEHSYGFYELGERKEGYTVKEMLQYPMFNGFYQFYIVRFKDHHHDVLPIPKQYVEKGFGGLPENDVINPGVYIVKAVSDTAATLSNTADNLSTESKVSRIFEIVNNRLIPVSPGDMKLKKRYNVWFSLKDFCVVQKVTSKCGLNFNYVIDECKGEVISSENYYGY